MKTNYLVQEGENLVVILAIGHTPANAISVVPDSIQPEDYEFLKIEYVQDEMDPEREIPVVSVDEVKKAEVLAARAVHQAKAQIKQIVIDRINFGNLMIIEFAAENAELGINEESEAVLDAMAPIQNALKVGALELAITKIRTVPAEKKDPTFVNDTRLLQGLNQIEAYLGLPLSETL